jgi:hypothetical protein
MLLEQWNVVNKEHAYASRSMKLNVRTYFPKRECEALLLVDWKTLNKIINEDYINYYSIKATCTIKSDEGNDGMYAVGLTDSTKTIHAIKKYKPIAVSIKKDTKTLDKVRELV